ncbi:MAG: lamin tail domain-containing protein [Actinomycetota bacterium]|nr:lamin tail domain-containing protein [Actinomycetota bacterium]
MGDDMSMQSARWAAVVTTALALAAGGLAVQPALAAPGDVVISEIHYHPATDLDSDEFIELANPTGSPVDVSGWAFTEGIGAVLPAGTVIAAGGYLVLSPDAAQFQSLYGFAPDGVYTGKLSNGGEQVTLTDGAAVVVDQVSYLDATPWPFEPDGSGPSLELRGLAFDNTQPENWGPSAVNGGTPRAVNSINGTAPPPKAKEVTAAPNRPNPGQAVDVTARLPVGTSASLTYKVMFGGDASVPFLDDAASPGGAGDGVYAGTIPGQTAGKLIRYRIEGTFAGVAFSSPAASDSINYHGVVVENPGVVTQLPVLEWFMSDAVYNDILANHRFDNFKGEAVISYDGQVFDNARMRIRGQSSRTAAKVNWKIELPPGYEIDMRPNMPYLLDEFALQSDLDPRPVIAWDTVGDAGARRLGIFNLRSQRNGEFWSVGQAMETMDGSWRDDQDVSDWAIYKGNKGGLTTAATPTALENLMWAGCGPCEPEQYLEKKEREFEDYTDVWQLTQVLDKTPNQAQRDWIMQNVNIPEMVNYMAINVIMRHQDSNWKNWWISRDTDGTGRWEMWHWDLNRTWIRNTSQTGEFLTADAGNRLLRDLMADPDISAMYFRRLRTLADQFLAPGGYEAQWDTLTQQYASDWDLDRAKWGGPALGAESNRFYGYVQDRRDVIANNTGPGKPVPTSQAAAPNIVINEIQYQPAGGTNAEFIELTNPSATTSVDVSGWTIDGLGLTIQPGTVILPRHHVVFVKNDVTFRATHPGPDALVGGEYPGDLSDTGETVSLMQGARVVDTVTYSPSAPWPTAAAGSGPSLELTSTSADNSLPASWTATSTVGGTPGADNTGGAPPPPPPPPPPGTAFSDTFTGPNGGAWAAEWAVSARRGGTATIQSNAGRLLTTTTGGSYARAHLDGVAAAADQDLLFSFQWNSANPRAYFNVYVRGSGGWRNKFRPRNGYGLQFTSDSTAVQLRKMVNGNNTILRSTSGVQQLGSGKQWVRLQAVGSTVRYRVWSDGQPEPSSWTVSLTDSSVSAPGQVFVSLATSSTSIETKTLAVDDLVLSSP